MNTVKDIMGSVETNIRNYLYNNNGINPKSIFISRSMVDILKTDYRTVTHVNEETELTLCGLKVYEVLQENVIKVTD